MSDLKDLYQEVILDHGRRPRNFGSLPTACHQKEGFNPLCGDKIILYVEEKNGVLTKLQFEGCGCAISMASSSLMTESLQGKSREEAKELFSLFHKLITDIKITSLQQEKLGKLVVLGGVKAFPMRVKCASLAWHTLNALLNNAKKTTVTTE